MRRPAGKGAPWGRPARRAAVRGHASGAAFFWSQMSSGLRAQTARLLVTTVQRSHVTLSLLSADDALIVHLTAGQRTLCLQRPGTAPSGEAAQGTTSVPRLPSTTALSTERKGSFLPSRPAWARLPGRRGGRESTSSSKPGTRRERLTLRAHSFPTVRATRTQHGAGSHAPHVTAEVTGKGRGTRGSPEHWRKRTPRVRSVNCGAASTGGRAVCGLGTETTPTGRNLGTRTERF